LVEPRDIVQVIADVLVHLGLAVDLACGDVVEFGAGLVAVFLLLADVGHQLQYF
jgi:hypothetical protein